MKRLDDLIKHDWFSDAVTRGLSSVGVTPEIRDAATPIVNLAVTKAVPNLLPAQGITPPSPQIASIPQATGFKYASNTSPWLIGAGAVIILYFLVKGK